MNSLLESPIFFAAVGDVHGHMLRMIDLVKTAETNLGISVSFVLQTGDFEPIRDDTDLITMSAPKKFLVLGDYHKFHLKQSSFPWPVYFIGGNHEPFGYLDTMLDGGKITDNCYYMGRIGRQIVHGLNIVGLTGIYSQPHFTAQRPNVKRILSSKKKLYGFFNEDDVWKAICYEKTDILLVHDWPKNIGKPQVMPKKARARSARGMLGNKFTRLIIEGLYPQLVLCGHMHCSHNAHISHSNRRDTLVYCLANVLRGKDAIQMFKVSKSAGGTDSTYLISEV